MSAKVTTEIKHDLRHIYTCDRIASRGRKKALATHNWNGTRIVIFNQYLLKETEYLVLQNESIANDRLAQRI